ncbi:MAG: lipopolysaccharide heptosyltransferase II [Pseudomonadota bacterium]
MTRQVLVVGPSWVGDMVMADALFRTLAARGAVVDVVAPGWSLPILERMPSVRRGFELKAGHGEFALGARRALGRKLRSYEYEQAIVLPRSFKSALVPFFARVPMRTGFRGEMRYGLINDRRAFDRVRLDQTIKRFVWLGLAPGERLPDELPRPSLVPVADAVAATCARLDLMPEPPTVALLPGAEYGPAKCWPLPHFRALAERLHASGANVWVLGSDKDREAGEFITAGGIGRNLAGETALAEACDLLACCDAAVTNDSGLMHVAAAVGCWVVAIYGSSSPAFTPPLTDRATVMYRALDCSPCFQRECPLGHLDCLNGISPAEVMARLQPRLVPPST